MNPTEELAILTAMEKAVKDRIKEVRAIANDELTDAFNDYGVEKIGLRVNGEKVGDFAVTFEKEGYAITDQEQLDEFALDYGLAYYADGIKDEAEAISYLRTMAPEFLERKVAYYVDWDKAITYSGGECLYMDSGMEIPGIEYKPKRLKGTRVTGCNPQEVIPRALKAGHINQLLLGGDDGR